MERVFQHWNRVSVGLHETFGLDTTDPALWRKPWGFLISRIERFLETEAGRVVAEEVYK